MNCSSLGSVCACVSKLLPPLPPLPTLFQPSLLSSVSLSSFSTGSGLWTPTAGAATKLPSRARTHQPQCDHSTPGSGHWAPTTTPQHNHSAFFPTPHFFTHPPLRVAVGSRAYAVFFVGSKMACLDPESRLGRGLVLPHQGVALPACVWQRLWSLASGRSCGTCTTRVRGCARGDPAGHLCS